MFSTLKKGPSSSSYCSIFKVLCAYPLAEQPVYYIAFGVVCQHFFAIFSAAFPVTGGCRLPSGGRKTVLYEHAAQKSTPFFKFFEKIKTTGLAGGLSKPYKGIILAKPLKGPRMGLPTAFLSRGRPLKGPLFYALVFLLPVNGSTNSLRLSWSAI